MGWTAAGWAAPAGPPEDQAVSGEAEAATAAVDLGSAGDVVWTAAASEAPGVEGDPPWMTWADAAEDEAWDHLAR